jgi:hypothetical protein
LPIAFAAVVSFLDEFSASGDAPTPIAGLKQEIFRVSHPTTPGSVMNYDQNISKTIQEPDCAPHPLDVLAITALNQSAPTPTRTP